ncbi:MAG: isochorismatase family protein [Fuerstiella sp.]|nr:isochorismatase family protein [Fuerstiella sp.]
MTDLALLRNPELLCRHRSHLLVVDVQEKLIPAIHRGVDLVHRINFVLEVAHLFQVPVVVSEQYPCGLGHTVSELANHPAIGTTFDKVRFSAAECFCEHVGKSADIAPDAHEGRNQVVLVGMESHVCILQTSLDLLGRGYRVYVAEDAVGSGRQHDHEIGIHRLRDAGVTICTVESVAFEWCETADVDQFKSMSRLVRNLRD